MAGRGPAPKDPSQVRRRNTPPVLKLVVADGEVRGPDLPGHIEWPDVTLEWWEEWRVSAMSTTFTQTDWSTLLEAAVLHMKFWDGDMSVASELRLRVAKFGATPEDRARLRLTVGEPTSPTSQPQRSRMPLARRSRVQRVAEPDAGA